MKVVLLAGGLGTRMREETDFRPKPMVLVGGRPVLWHIMKVYSYFGHNEFVICTGYKNDFIKNYFLNYRSQHNDFTIDIKNDVVTYHKNRDTSSDDWKVTVVDTGEFTETGGRIKRIQQYIDSDTFMCTYGDGIADVSIDALLESHKKRGPTATLTITRPSSRFGVVDLDKHNGVTGFLEKPKDDAWINIGYFVFNYQIFEYLSEDSNLESEVLPQLAKNSQLNGFKHVDFWRPMDTFREANQLNELWASGKAPWNRYL